MPSHDLDSVVLSVAPGVLHSAGESQRLALLHHQQQVMVVPWSDTIDIQVVV